MTPYEDTPTGAVLGAVVLILAILGWGLVAMLWSRP